MSQLRIAACSLLQVTIDSGWRTSRFLCLHAMRLVVACRAIGNTLWCIKLKHRPCECVVKSSDYTAPGEALVRITALALAVSIRASVSSFSRKLETPLFPDNHSDEHGYLRAVAQVYVHPAPNIAKLYVNPPNILHDRTAQSS